MPSVGHVDGLGSWFSERDILLSSSVAELCEVDGTKGLAHLICWTCTSLCPINIQFQHLRH